ncbi:MAG: large subunit ribosomal protein L15 [Microgenomates group bacterium Gr01-1014_7]|nr:MAG: large subunit ribosomal protein L15 [Microgenomates group bacterium Gr01-1014_7]
MKLSNLPKIKTTGKKRLGRGIGSGKGKTGGRGTKGQKARGKIPVNFSGAGLALYKKLPLRRGLGNRQVSIKPKVLALSKLNIFKANTKITLEALLNARLITKKDLDKGIKLLADGKLTAKVIAKLPVSQKAMMEIQKIGGKVENV